MSRTKTEPPEHTTFIVANQSERFAPVRAVAVHSTESQDLHGSRDDIRGIRNWFNNPASDASSHVGIDGDGNSEVWVRSNRKAWTIGAANSFTENIEFVGRAAQPAKDWEEIQIKTGAKWAAYWCLKYNIPPYRGGVANIHGLCVPHPTGLITHKDVTNAGFGTHTDPGPNFPMDDFCDYTRFYVKNGWYIERTRI